MKKKNPLRSKSKAEFQKPLNSWATPVAFIVLAWAIFLLNRFDAKFTVSLDATLQFFNGFIVASYSNFPTVLIRHLQSLLIALLTCLGAFCWGNSILNLAKFSDGNLRERFVLGSALGLVLLSHSVFGLGVSLGVSRSIFSTFLILFFGFGVVLARGTLVEIFKEVKKFEFSALFSSPLSLILFLLILLPFVMAFVPEVFYDSLVYHLGLPQMFINEGRIVDTPFVYFSRFPMFMHMLYTLGLVVDGSTVAKLFNWVVFLLGLSSMVLVCERLGRKKAGIVAALIVAAIPVVQINIWSTAVDAAMGSFTVIAFLAYLAWKRDSGNMKFLFLVSLLVGTVFGIKYPGVTIVIAFFVALFVSTSFQEGFSLRMKPLLIFVLGSFVMMAPWFVRNYLWTGNPTYPILSSVIPSRNINPKGIQAETSQISKYSPKTILGYLTYPWDMSFKETTSANFVGPMLLAVLPFLLLLQWKDFRELRDLLIVLSLSLPVGMKFSGDIRFLLPPVFLLSLLLALCAVACLDKSWISKILFYGIVFVCTGYQLMWIFYYCFALYRPAPVLVGMESRSAYSATMHDGLNLWPWNPIEAKLKTLPDTACVYVLGNEQVFGFPKKFVYSSVHDFTPLVLWANESVDSTALLEKIKSEKITHVLLNVPESVRLKGYNLFHWAGNGMNTFIDFSNRHLELIHVNEVAGFKGALYLFEVKDHLTAPSPIKDFGTFFAEVLNFKNNG